MNLSYMIAVFVLLTGFVAEARPVESSKIMISAANQTAVDAGLEIARKGGNLIDVSVAVGLTLAVTNPFNASLGGGGFAMFKQGKDPVRVLDFREVAPKATHPKFYLEQSQNDASRTGAKAVAVPGMLAGWWELHSQYGKLKWKKVIQPAIDAAEDGFPLFGAWVDRTERQKPRFDAIGTKTFFKKNEASYAPGELMKQPELAKALKRIRSYGASDFYEGRIGKDLVQSLKKRGGVITMKDLKSYKVRWLEPLTTDFKGHKAYMMPPPSSGGVVIAAALRLVEKAKLENTESLSANEFHYLIEVLKLAFRGRSLLGDPDFHKNPIDKLLSDAYLDPMVKGLKRKKAIQLKPLKEKTFNESNETTHFSVINDQGEAFSSTVTLNGGFGSAVVTDKYRISLNNEMDDFTTRPGEANMFGLIQGQGNEVVAGKRPLSSMSPTLIEKDGKIVLSLGAPGGPRIITGVFHALYRYLVRGQDIDSAIQARRVHHQFLPDKVIIDGNRFAPETLNELKKRGHNIEPGWMARVYAVGAQNGRLQGAFDSRAEGAAGGY